MSPDRTPPVVAQRASQLWRSANPWRAGLAAFFLGLAAGCEGSLNKSPQAVALPAAEKDAAEAVSADGQWPAWRGPNSAGVSTEKNLPIAFGPQSGVRWKVDVPGIGNSSPVVWGDRIYLTSALDAAGSPLVLLAFDRSTGKQLWRAEAAQSTGASHDKNGHASASVATNGRLIFASFGPSGLFALDENGQLLWRQSLGELEHGWGTASSPVLFEDLVIQLADCQADSSIRAFRQATGEPVWSTPRQSTGCWTTPVLIETPSETGGGGSRHELIVNGTGTADGSPGYVIAYDPRTGQELWRVRGTTDIVCPTAIVASGLIYSMSGRNGPILAIKPGGTGDVTQSNVVWKSTRGGPYVPTGVAYRNRLYVVNDGGVLACHNAGDGTRIWQQRLRGAFTSSLVAGDGLIYAINERGTVYVVAADDQYRLLAENDLDERMLATPAVSHGELLLRTETHLWCIAAKVAGAAQAQREESSTPSSIEATSPAPAQTVEWSAASSARGFGGSIRAADLPPPEMPATTTSLDSPTVGVPAAE
jgi:outer membrane protein assembly factor BamB